MSIDTEHGITPDRQLRELVAAGVDPHTLELCACKMTLRNSDYYLFNWYRLLPGRKTLEPLGTFNDGSYDAKDAASERRDTWPNAIEVEYTFLLNLLASRIDEKVTYCTHAQCTRLAYGTCNNCRQPVCILHYASGDWEDWCLPCYRDYLDMLRIDQQFDADGLDIWQKARTHIELYLYQLPGRTAAGVPGGAVEVRCSCCGRMVKEGDIRECDICGRPSCLDCAPDENNPAGDGDVHVSNECHDCLGVECSVPGADE